MYCYKLKENTKHESMFVEGIKLQKYEWYCVNKKDIKLDNNILVESGSFKGYSIPEELKLTKPVKEVKKSTRGSKSAKKIEEVEEIKED